MVLMATPSGMDYTTADASISAIMNSHQMEKNMLTALRNVWPTNWMNTLIKYLLFAKKFWNFLFGPQLRRLWKLKLTKKKSTELN